MTHPDPTTLETQVGKKGKPFRHSGTRKDERYPEKWINGELKWCCIHTFRYEEGGFFEVSEDYWGNTRIIKKC